uniref:SEA domain-containing protein n=1 Tax=Oryzias latipes TaxID=8090 RepID=A0A3P9MJK4_ORYLA
MAPKNALRSKSTGGGPGVAGLRDKREVEPCGSSLTAWMREAGTNGSRTRALDGMPARWFVTIGAVLMLMMQSSSAAEAEGGLYESLQGADIPQEPVALSSPTSTPGTEDKEELGSDVSLQPWSEVFANAKTAVWTETEAVRTGENGKAFAETGIVTGTGAWVETVWRPVETQRPNVHEDPAVWPGPEHLQMSREIEREQAAFSSVLKVVSEMAELQAPAKPLGLLSKAAWTRSLSSVASKASSPSPAKALSLTSSASPSSSSSAFVNESQTEASINVAVVPGNISSNNITLVLRFVGPTDNIYSCSFVQMLEQRLGNAFDEAQDKVLETYNRLSVEIQSVSQEPGSPSVTLVYMVKNEDTILNGTISSGLLNQLTAELVGYFLFYPPLVIAEPLEYHNLNTSTATRSYWVITGKLLISTHRCTEQGGCWVISTNRSLH